MSVGPLDDWVKAGSILLGAAAAFTLAFRGRSKFEPDAADFGGAASKVAAVFVAALLAVTINDEGRGLGLPPSQQLLMWCLFAAAAGLLSYLFLNALLGFEREEPVSESRTRKVRIIGGLWLTSRARALRREGDDIQTLLRRAGNHPDHVWPRTAIATAHVLVVLSYITLMVGASGALAIGALLLQSSLSQG